MAAAAALVEVEQGGHAEDALIRLAPRSGPDRGLAWFLALGVLRRRARVDAALRPHLSRPLEALDAPVRAVLRVGAFEQLFARTPAHAAVDQGVEAAAALGLGRARGLVNAVLRRVAPPKDLSTAEALDHPDWLVERWTARYGAEATARWCRANNEPPPLTLVARGDPAHLARLLGEAGLEVRPGRAAGREIPGVLRVEGHEGPVPDLPGFEEGAFWVQDPAAVAVTDLLGAAEGARVLDACAAPGGKTFRLASRGARPLAVDLEAGRLDLLRASAARLGLQPEGVLVHDWTAGPLPGVDLFDAVLVDAPCTALGLVRRHPEIRWRRQPGDLAPSATRQRAIVGAAARHLAPGGALVYAVCSPEPEEGPEVVAHLLGDRPDLRLDAELHTAPPVDDEDAFYAARLVRA